MRVFISMDMEGVAGITTDPQREPDHEDYRWARQVMAAEANAAISGAFEAGAKEVLINDSHNTMDNMIPEQLDRRARLITGQHKPLSMMEGLSRKFDAAMFVGYHARRGTAAAIMDHTYCGAINEIRINGKPVGETAINGLYAGALGVPLVMVSGDQSLQKEVQQLNSGIETVVVKSGISGFCAANDHPEVAQQKIKQGAINALTADKWPKPLAFRGAYRFEIDLAWSYMADMASIIPGVTRKGPRTIAFKQEDYVTAFKMLLVMVRVIC